jgi:hypothetical protein
MGVQFSCCSETSQRDSIGDKSGVERISLLLFCTNTTNRLKIFLLLNFFINTYCIEITNITDAVHLGATN